MIYDQPGRGDETTEVQRYVFGSRRDSQPIAVVAAEIKNGYVIDAASTDEKDKGADYARADDTGSVSVRLATKGLSPGGYTLVARGNSGGLIAVGAFQVK